MDIKTVDWIVCKEQLQINISKTKKREIQKENKKKQYADSDISTDVLDKIHEVFLDSVGKITLSNSDKMLNYMSGQVLKLFKMNPIIIKEQFQNKIQKLNLQWRIGKKC